MTKSTQNLSQGSVQDIAAGILLMAVFTLLWTGIAESGLHHRDHAVEGILFSLISLFLIIYALYLFALSKHFPVWAAAENRSRRQRMRRWYRIILESEFLTTGLAAGLLISTHHTDVLIPTVALVVGLHFYPMSKVYRQTVDYFLGTWISLVALAGLFLTLRHLLSQDDVSAIVGTGVATETSVYGFIIFYIIFRTPKPWVSNHSGPFHRE